MTNGSICLFPKLNSTGGPSSFQKKLTTCLSQEGIEVHFDLQRRDIAAVLVVGGSSHLSQLASVKKRGIRIVQRLDGMNWLHKVNKTGLRHYLRSEWNNAVLSTIRKKYADFIVYQSQFTREWWKKVYGEIPAPDTVIHNGVDIDLFTPTGEEKPPQDHLRVMVVEGSFYGGHQRDLLNALDFARGLADRLKMPVELVIASRAPQAMLDRLPVYENVHLNWLGIVPLSDIPSLDRSAHLFFPAEINAACPNSVIEAMACGLPVVGFATGSIPELVGNDGGLTAPYGSDYWKLEAPQLDELVEAGMEIYHKQDQYRNAARERAITYFDMRDMAQRYLEILIP